ncbi:TetR/AcrR family transcriptional regulator [Solimonas terrae]|uniref:TetR/AcrR family transcriptional regulator n=1 Tax=Solimonas terrae TaxID=1396819 RepID=A0A6M2BLD9_9GAMM|nr:TetR/AcrR family transcriptional regulator [Solimonas terrae]NGY03274.1 TetR/AcrR family transcriptional regulator [Solimonas terrae]
MTFYKDKPMIRRDIAKTARRLPRPAKTKSERREEAMTRILDSAEKLFAQDGRNGVTVRALAKEAAVDPGLVHYYFENMDGVFRAVFRRKSVIVNAIRNEAMDAYLAEHGDAPTVDGAFEVFLRPMFETIWKDPTYWTNYVAIVSHANSSPFGGAEAMREAFDFTVGRFIDLLKRVAPHVPPQEIYWFYHLMSGSVTLTLAQTGRIDVLSGGLCKSTDMKSAFDSMKQVFSGGFETVMARHAKTAKVRAPRSVRKK